MTSSDEKRGTRRDRSARRAMNLHLLDPSDIDDGGMPMLDPVEADPDSLVAFTECARAGNEGAAVHFFLEDFRFEGVWSEPGRYVGMLKRFPCVLTPDFSVYVDMPLPMQTWNLYRGLAVGRIWQKAGLRVVPTLTWGDDDFDLWFGHLPRGGTVAISSVGLMDSEGGVEMFEEGASAACGMLAPRNVIAYGTEHGFDSHGAPVTWYEPDMYRKFAGIRESRDQEGR